MNSAISTEERGLPTTRTAQTADPGLRPWQFFLLAGMLAATGVVLVATGQSPASIIVLSLTVVSASFVALGAYRALAPLVVADAGEMPQLIVGHTRAALEREKTLTLRAIKDLEFDYAMKKMSQPDYEEMSTRLRARAIGLMRQLDSGGGYREAIEREIAARVGGVRGGEATAVRSTTGAVVPGIHSESTTSVVPTNTAASSAEGTGLAVPSGTASAPTCACGAVNDHDARFCKKCGTALSAT